MEHLKAYNQKLLANILPEHVAAHFLSTVNSDVSKRGKKDTKKISTVALQSIKLHKSIDYDNNHLLHRYTLRPFLF